jgi:mRNA-degrading endonuclease RelE of RelBE toxin-antitoxin system
MNYKIISLKSFEKDAKRLFKKYPSIISDLRTLFEDLLVAPTQGIPLRKDCYKIRIAVASKGNGKS